MKSYTGRFAPSPTGRLHTGSVLAAVGSFVDARHHGGRWLVRIEDLDTRRVVAGSAHEILRTLETLNLFWDGEVTYQSTRLALYRAGLEQLRASGRTYECSCSRRSLAAQADGGYPGTCRAGPRQPGATATRFRIRDGEAIEFTDRFQGMRRLCLDPLGDVVVRRRDGIFAYQLAVVIDDAAQSISDVVRGADLIDSTAWQLELQRALGYPRPHYAHLPVVTAPGGGKLAKSRHSVPPDLSNPSQVLWQCLTLLAQRPPPQLAHLLPREVLEWAVLNWKPSRLHRIATVEAR
ncbi:MAG TPA: tRNA glutamyl-Q(34) synthetase GluQRS [Steroidobacteraceae bacterium]